MMLFKTQCQNFIAKKRKYLIYQIYSLTDKTKSGSLLITPIRQNMTLMISL